jgi:hypothetical protein
MVDMLGLKCRVGESGVGIKDYAGLSGSMGSRPFVE